MMWLAYLSVWAGATLSLLIGFGATFSLTLFMAGLVKSFREGDRDENYSTAAKLLIIAIVLGVASMALSWVTIIMAEKFGVS